MKKLTMLILAILLSALLLIPSVAADDVPIEAEDIVSVAFSEDYTTLTLDGVGYSRVNVTLLDYRYHDTFDVAAEFVFSEIQQKTVDEIYMTQNEQATILHADIHFHDGAELLVYFLRDDCRAEYDLLVSGQGDTYTVVFGWPDDNILTVDKNALFGKEVTLSQEELEDYDDFSVKIQSKDGSLSIQTGFLLVDDDVFYYADREKSGIEYEYFHYLHYEKLTVWEITDPDLLEQLNEAKALYDDDIALFDVDLSGFFASAGLITVFILLPLAAAILCFILFCRAKKPFYKKLCLTVSLLAVAELVTVILLLVCNAIPG